MLKALNERFPAWPLVAGAVLLVLLLKTCAAGGGGNLDPPTQYTPRGGF